jgi:hypothetical protein
MLFHASISAHEPERVARALARIWQGEAHPFPPAEGAWIALAGDDRGTAIEVYRFGTEMRPGEIEVKFGETGAASEHTANHQAIGTSLDEARIVAIAEQEGWKALRCNRGPFEVIEVWLENRILVEVLTPEMQRQYLAFLTPANWKAFLAEAGSL